jgi:glycosyltransferase involved in cell wall biosynthesis
MLIPRLTKDGHEVVVSAIAGLHGAEIEWDDPELDDFAPVRVRPSGQYGFGVDTLIPYIVDERPDLVLTVMDCRMLGQIAEQLREAPLACWVPADTSPLSRPEQAFLAKSQAMPIAMTRWGEQLLRDADGVAMPAYIPHGVDTAVFTRQLGTYNHVGQQVEDRDMLGVPQDAFIIGMVAANSDGMRKGFPEQFEAFRRIRAVNEKVHLMVHTVARSAQGCDLEQLAMEMGIAESISFSQPAPQIAGNIDDAHMARIYRASDVLSLCSYGEGFGVPLIEAMACGTPVVTTDFGAMKEIAAAAGFMVAGDPFWNPVHKSWWYRPSIDSIASGYRYFAAMKGKEGMESLSQRARARGCQYDIDVVFNEGWRPFLAAWEAGR